MSNTFTIDAAFLGFRTSNLKAPSSFIDTLRAARQDVNAKAPNLQGSGYNEEYMINYEEVQKAAFFSKNVFVAQLGDEGKLDISGSKNQMIAIGGDKADTLIGGAGADILVGGGSTPNTDHNIFDANTLVGGGGRDLFVVGKGDDAIYEFQMDDAIMLHPDVQNAAVVDWTCEDWGTDENRQQAYGFTATLSTGNKMFFELSKKEIAELLSVNVLSLNNLSLTQLNERVSRKIESRFINFAPSQFKPPSVDETRGGVDANGNKDIFAIPGSEATLVGGDGNDIFHAIGAKNTMTGNKGADHFHVVAGNENIVTDFNYHQRDKIVISGLREKFDKTKVEVTSEGYFFNVRYDGKLVAQLRKYDGMPMTNAVEKIKELVVEGYRTNDMNVYYGKRGSADSFRLDPKELTSVRRYDIFNDTIRFPEWTKDETLRKLGVTYNQSTAQFFLTDKSMTSGGNPKVFAIVNLDGQTMRGLPREQIVQQFLISLGLGNGNNKALQNVMSLDLDNMVELGQ